VAAGVTAGAAVAASSTGTVTETINIGVRSLTVSPTSAAMCTPANPLTFPNGNCGSSTITITNGPAGGHVDVQGASALPSDNSGNGWALCGTAGNNCTGGNATTPGADQYLEQVTPANGGFGPALSTIPVCDTAFSAGCVSIPGEVGAEAITLTGPSSSSDQSTTFNSSVTWTAAP
jgi:hypothetical protein